MIDSFSGEYRFLSNFHPCSVVYNKVTFPSVEHAYQAAKSTERSEHLRIAKLKTAGEAKREGNKLKLRRDWERVKLSVMRDLLRQKFMDPSLKKQLLDTAPSQLVEGNNWNDTFWGVCDGQGKNWLGKLLMEIRGYWLQAQDD